MKKDSKITRYLVPVLIMLAGIVFICYGISDGEVGAVLKKAVAICMECIGIG